jgi:hypothetical protein
MGFAQQNSLTGQFVEHLSQTLAAQQSLNKFNATIVVNLVSPKAAAKQKFFLTYQSQFVVRWSLFYTEYLVSSDSCDLYNMDNIMTEPDFLSPFSFGQNPSPF